MSEWGRLREETRVKGVKLMNRLEWDRGRWGNGKTKLTGNWRLNRKTNADCDKLHLFKLLLLKRDAFRCFQRGGCSSGGRAVGHQSDGRWFDKASLGKTLNPTLPTDASIGVWMSRSTLWVMHRVLYQCVNVAWSGGFEWSARATSTVHLPF